MEKTEAIYLKLPETLSKWLDSIVAEEGYTSKQEFIREIVRQAVTQYKIQEFHKTLDELHKKVKVKRVSPILTKSEKDKISKEYFKKKGFEI